MRICEKVKVVSNISSRIAIISYEEPDPETKSILSLSGQ
jgi:hypothetical protein